MGVRIKQSRERDKKKGRQSRQPFPGRAVPFSEHPVRVAAVSAVATAAFLITIVFPTVSKVQDARIANIENDNSSLKGQIESLKEANKALKAQVPQLRKELNILKAGEVFSGANPYPVGYRLVKIGEPVSSVLSAYKNLKPDVKDDWISVSGGNPLFGRATFYKSSDKEPVVNAILFDMTTMEDEELAGGLRIATPKDHSDVVLAKLIEAFGKADQQTLHDGKSVSCWFNRAGVNIQYSWMGLYLDKYDKSAKPSCM